MSVSRIAQRLRDAGIGCEIVNLVPTPTAVLWRDRIIVILALGLLTGLAWSLSADMSMGGMDMTGFRMIPSDMALMVPADMPWWAMEFIFVFAMWTVMMVGMMMGYPAISNFGLPYRRKGFDYRG
jgi:predicted metal-binding membrane protein